MLIYFRLSSEHAGAYRECPIATSTITVGELKQLLARRCGFAAEYKRKIDFRVFLVSTNSTKTKTDQTEGDGVEDLVEVEHEDQQVQGFSRVVLQRTVVRGQTCQDVLQHNARTQLTADEWASAEGRQSGGKKRRLPPEWICGLCHGLMRSPLLVKCASNCGHSACRSCIEARLKEQHVCPFCRSPFRQVIRNKRLEEILKNINIDEYEQPVGGGLRPQPGDVSDARIPTPAGGASQPAHPKPHEGPPAAPNTGIQEGPLFASAAVAVKGETGADAVSNGWGVARAPNKGPSYPPLAPRSGPRHFVYLQPQKNLQLMRHFDMMVVDAASELATALANACVREAESAAAPAPAGETGGGAGQSSSSSSPQEFYLVPCCLCGGGSSFCIGGFVRLRADNRVPPTDRVASDLLSQWQLQGPLQGASAPPTYIDATAGGPQGVRTPAYVLRVNWIEKYGRMPMLPSRKQPLCGLFGGPRRGPLGGSAASVTGTPQGSGLLRRTSLGPCVEVVVDESKYDEVASCVRDYVQYGSRSNEPWRQGGGGPLGPQAQAAGEASAADTHTAARNSPARATVSVSGGPPDREAPPFSVASLLSLASAQVPARRQQQQQQQQQGAATAAAGGPKPLPLPGRPLNPRNPFLGYTAILPFLSEEQFNHVRRLQLKALKRAGIVFRGPNLEGTKTPASCASKGRSSHDSDGRSSSGEHETQNAPTATRTHALPTAREKHPTGTDHAGGTTAASTSAEATAAAATATATATATPTPTAAAATAVTGVLLAAKPSRGVSKSAPFDAADRGPPVAPKRAAGPPAPKGRRAIVVVPPPLKRLRAAVGQGTWGAPTAKGSDAGGSSLASPEKLGAPSENPGPSVGPTTLSATNPVQSEGESSAATQRQLVCRDTLAHAANENSSGEEAADAGATPMDSLACSCAVDALQSAPEGGAAVSTAMHAAAAEAHQ